MAILAMNASTPKELIPAGNYVARCYQMLHIGTVTETILGEVKTLNKVRIGWELPLELKVYSQERGEQPAVISKEYTLSMHEKSNLRKTLASWRGKDFTEEQAKSFDITALLGKPCMINIIHKPSKDGTRTYEEIAGVTPMPNGLDCPAQVNKTIVWDYEQPDMLVLDALPDFIKDKIKSSQEYAKLTAPEETHINEANNFYNPSPENVDDLPF